MSSMVRVCRTCPTQFSVELGRCPRCTGTDFVEEEGDMPKISVHGGASNKGWVATQPKGPAGVASDDEGGESVSDGNSSSTSTEKPQKRSASKKRAPRKRAQTTELPSTQDPEEGSTVPSTDTPGPDGS